MSGNITEEFSAAAGDKFNISSKDIESLAEVGKQLRGLFGKKRRTTTAPRRDSSRAFQMEKARLERERQKRIAEEKEKAKKKKQMVYVLLGSGALLLFGGLIFLSIKKKG